MKSIYTFLSGLVIIGGLAWASETYWQQDVHYTMQVRLDPEEHQLAGTSRITYTNHSPDTLRQSYLILYPNAFKVGSVKYREARQVYQTGGADIQFKTRHQQGHLDRVGHRFASHRSTVFSVHPYRSAIRASGTGNLPRRFICDTAE